MFIPGWLLVLGVFYWLSRKEDSSDFFNALTVVGVCAAVFSVLPLLVALAVVYRYEILGVLGAAFGFYTLWDLGMECRTHGTHYTLLGDGAGKGADVEAMQRFQGGK